MICISNHIIDQSDGPIQYLRRKDIDLNKWDACIAAAPNGLIYARSFYLDAMTAKQWDALVLGNYEAVMPLTWRRKAGIRYLYQPAFTQQGGIFSTQDLSQALIGSFLNRLAGHFRFAEIFLNHANPFPALSANANFILYLDVPYEQLLANYKKNHVRNLNTAIGLQLNYIKDISLRTALDTYRGEYGDRTPHVKEKDYRRFEELCDLLQPTGQVILRGVTDREDRLLATALLLLDLPSTALFPATRPARMYLLLPATLSSGRKASANHFLLDSLIKEWAGNSLILDFEGSDLPGIARFYEGFGSIDQPYFFYRNNNLPWPLNMLKRD